MSYGPAATVDFDDPGIPASLFGGYEGVAPIGHSFGGFGGTVTAQPSAGPDFGPSGAGFGSVAVNYDPANSGASVDNPNVQEGGTPASIGDSLSTVGETPPPPLRVVPLPPEERPPPRVNQPALAPLPVVPLPADEAVPAPVVDRAVGDRAAQDAQAEGDAANERRRRAAVIRDRQNPTGPRGLLTRPLVQRPRLLGQ